MSLNVAPMRLKKTLRLIKIKELLPLGKTYHEIAEICGVNDRTMDRDIAEWQRNGGREEWVRNEFFRLHHAMVTGEKETLAYSHMAQLFGKTLTQKVEQHVEGGTDIRIVIEDGKDATLAETPRADKDSEE